jgi:hypothetical protein
MRWMRARHPLGPQQGPHRGVAEAARVLLTDDQNDEVRHGLIEVDQEPLLWVEIHQRSRQPGDGREVADHRIADSLLAPGVGLERPIPSGLD